MGYLSDPPSLDLMEVEEVTANASKEMLDIRREMIDGKSKETTIETFVVSGDKVKSNSFFGLKMLEFKFVKKYFCVCI